MTSGPRRGFPWTGILSGLFVFMGVVVGLDRPARAADPAWESPAPMYATADLASEKRAPVRGDNPQDSHDAPPTANNLLLNYGQVMIPDEAGPLLLVALFPEINGPGDQADVFPPAQWVLILDDKPVTSVRGSLSGLSCLGMATEVSAYRDRALSVAIAVTFNHPLPAQFLPAIFLVRLTPAREALPGSCHGLACFRFNGASDYPVAFVRQPGIRRSLVLRAGDTWLIQPFQRLAEITKPETGEGGTLLNYWIAQLDHPDLFPSATGENTCEP